jgi:asparagine synthase (glutamine-hydrolysing)
MCGIAGIVRLDRQPVDPAELAQMAEMLSHRGPDDQGTYLAGPAGLAHRRLSIIDLSPAGRQPMTNEDETIWLVFNGEIYNYRDLAATLQSLGHQFRSQTDSEVIIHAYEEWGEQCVERMRGMWAFAIWDASRGVLFCSRDRLGIKPFYYYHDGQRFAFASEIKGIAALPQVTLAPDFKVLYRFLVHCVADCDERTTFRNIRQLPPGHNLTVRGAMVTKLRYWSPPLAAEPEQRSDGQCAEQLLSLLTESMQEHLQSDVPVGACLSGGVDSCALVSIAAKLLGQPLPTFSVEYPGTAYDESRYIDAMGAAYPALRMHRRTPDGSELLEVLERAVWHFDEPMWAPNVYSWWQVMKLVHDHGIKVVVNGQGGDELLAGYPRYTVTYLRQLLAEVRLGTLWREARATAGRTGESVYRLLREVLRPLVPSALRRAKQLAGFRTSGDESVLAPEFRSAAAEGGKPRDFVYWNLHQHLAGDLHATRLPELLHAEDRFSMAFSIESRVPFLDHRLVEFAAALPDRQKICRGETKAVLRWAMAGIVPKPVLERKDKMGYPTPAGAWLRQRCRDHLRDLFGSRTFRDRGIFEPTQVARRLESFLATGRGVEDIWRWLGVEMWFRTFVDKRPAPRAAALACAS